MNTTERFTLKASDNQGEFEAQYETQTFPVVGERLQRGATKGFWTVTKIDTNAKIVYAGRVEYL